SILALIAVYGAARQYPNNLNESQSMRSAQLGAYSLIAHNPLEYFHYKTRFADIEPLNTIAGILNGSQKPNVGQVQRG
ncbi:MAG: hypothetical protein ISQ32_05865, partial [Rickettsiales bacterium]|nr:hypothetical protein [Rickettsiales bacterium]